MLISVFNVRCWKSSFTPVSSVSLNNQTQILSVFLYGTFYFYVFICFICVMLFPLLEKLSQAAKAIYTIIYSPSIFSGEETSPIFPQARFFHISCIWNMKNTLVQVKINRHWEVFLWIVKQVYINLFQIITTKGSVCVYYVYKIKIKSVVAVISSSNK